MKRAPLCSGRAALALGLLAAADQTVTLDRRQSTPHAIRRARLERELEALLTDGARGANLLGRAGVGLGHGEKHRGVSRLAGGVVEEISWCENWLGTRHVRRLNALPTPVIPVPAAAAGGPGVAERRIGRVDKCLATG